ncbi:MAG: hypothetical protein HUJ80_08535 [Firmicutes bacterium]|nr:hypothetical protein [Bacillota bacterium]
MDRNNPFIITDIVHVQNFKEWFLDICMKPEDEQYQFFYLMISSAMKYEQNMDYKNAALYYHWAAVISNECLALPGSELIAWYYNEKAIMLDYAKEYVQYNRVLNYDEWELFGIYDIKSPNGLSPDWEKPVFDQIQSMTVSEESLLKQCQDLSNVDTQALFSMVLCSAFFYERIGKVELSAKWYKMSAFMIDNILRPNCSAVISEYYLNKSVVLSENCSGQAFL